jgi:hypothetical protein
MRAGDLFDMVSGSTGFTGAADTTLVLSKDSQGVTLYGHPVENRIWNIRSRRPANREKRTGLRVSANRSTPGPKQHFHGKGF